MPRAAPAEASSPSVLFVRLERSDEERATAFLRRHGMIARFAPGEREAAAAVDVEPPAAVVCCAQPSSAATLGLLRRVRVRRPEAARIVVLGEPDLAAVVRAVRRQTAAEPCLVLMGSIPGPRDRAPDPRTT